MDSSSWIHGYAANSNGGGGGNSGFMCGYAPSCIPSVLQCREEEQQHELLLGSQIQQHLNQINMHLNLDEIEAVAFGDATPFGDIGFVVDDFFHSQHAAAGGCSFPSSSSTSSSFRSTSLSCSPEISSTAAHVLAAPATGLQFSEVSSLAAASPLVVLPYDDKHALSFLDTPAEMAPGEMSTSASVFKRYEKHLGPRRRPKPACGQRMFKTAMSVLAKMHSVMRYNHQQQQQHFYYQQQQQQQESAAEPSAVQLQEQHMISERKRREKLKDSFHALKTVLPPSSKKLDKTSMLTVAREYVNSLKSKVCELEEKNQALQSKLARCATSVEEEGVGQKVEIQMTRAAAAEQHQTGEVCTVEIATPARSNTMGVVLKTLQCLKDQMGEDVSLVSMTTGDGPHRTSLTLHLKSASGAKWEAVRETMAKAVAISSDDESTTATCRGGGAAGLPRRL